MSRGSSWEVRLPHTPDVRLPTPLRCQEPVVHSKGSSPCRCPVTTHEMSSYHTTYRSWQKLSNRRLIQVTYLKDRISTDRKISTKLPGTYKQHRLDNIESNQIIVHCLNKSYFSCMYVVLWIWYIVSNLNAHNKQSLSYSLCASFLK